MTDRPLVIIASARKDSNTELFVNNVFKDMDIEKLELLDYNISPFNYSSTYPTKDEFGNVVECMLRHRIIVFATPVYWYAMSGLLKTFFDRFTDLVTANKKTGRLLKGKSVFLIAVGADKEIPLGFEVPFSLTSDYLDLTYEGSIYHSTKWKESEESSKSEVSMFRDKIEKKYS